ncbi:ROK family transcriptional regulator [Kineococcus sp. SYSU DK004]|uniref:ROK family transcriptional regulator n=1 Tax=Kineococcus sp. SYSU DK004 TaxID=3383125 RepID=UPI003D7EAA66
MTSLDEHPGVRRRPGRPGARERLMDALRASGPVSRVELAALTGLTEASVSTTVRRLLQEGLVAEVGRAPTAGKPRTLLQLDPGGRTAVGIDLATTTVTYVLTSQTGGVLARLTRRIAARATADDLAARLAADVDRLLEGSGHPRGTCLGIGLVWGGAGDGMLRRAARGPGPDEAGQQRGVDGERLRSRLAELTGWPVLVENDATAAAVGEYWVARLDAGRSFAALYLADGIGAGLVLGGAAHRGAHGLAGEFGHVCVDVDGPACACGARGCLEAVAGPVAVVARALADPVARAEAGLGATSRRSVVTDFAAVARAARTGAPACRALLADSARYVAAAAETLVNLVDVDLLVLTGPGFAAASSIYGPAITERVGTPGRRVWGRTVGVTVSTAAATAPAVGAAALLLQERLAR